MEHTKEPWVIDAYGNIHTPDGQLLLGGVRTPMVSGELMRRANANARRIVACVNACDGIPTYQLFAEEDSPNKLGLLIEALKQQRDELLAALETAINRLDDMLIGDDGQAWKEAEKVMPKLRAAIAKVKP